MSFGVAFAAGSVKSSCDDWFARVHDDNFIQITGETTFAHKIERLASVNGLMMMTFRWAASMLVNDVIEEVV